ncbi:MAG: 30S ribosomal protein S8 [Patescibacteria group bacterium]
MNSPVHDLLIRIKNAYMARLNKVDGVTYSNFKKELLELLKRFKFIKDYEITQD